MKKGEMVELEIESIAFQGFSVARKDGIVHFIKGGLPGDVIIAELTKSKKKHKEGLLREIVSPSNDRVEPRCKHFGVCGGCSWQDLSYDKQLEWKKQHVVDSFKHLTKLEVGEFKEPMGSVSVYNYRNKMEFSFSASRWLSAEEVSTDEIIEHKDFAFGLHFPRRFDKVIDINECHIQKEEGNIILNEVRELALALGVSAYHHKEHHGFLRSMIIRYSRAFDELMIVLITSAVREEKESQFIIEFEKLIRKVAPKVTNLMHAINDTISPVKIQEISTVFGSGFITERILGVDYRISPFSFFQTNSGQLDNFIGEIINHADLKSSDTVWDLYCGTGSITLPASKKCSRIIGLELVKESIDDAKNNAELNGISNAEFICADLHAKDTPEILLSLPKPDVIIIDPPRAGMHKNLVSHIVDSEAEKIVYVSCNPTTQARDCELLSEKYDVVSVLTVDMFPHTYHVESIALLKKKKA